MIYALLNKLRKMNNFINIHQKSGSGAGFKITKLEKKLKHLKNKLI